MRSRASGFEIRILFPLVLLFLLAGCLPSSCQRVESQAISPADSLSRQIASQMMPDTLRFVRRMAGPEEAALAYPRTLRFGPDGRLYVSDAKQNSIYAFSEGGAFLDAFTWDGIAVPYLVGQRGDTLLVFNPEAEQIDFVKGEQLVHRVSLPADLPERSLRYVTADDEAIYVKVVAQDVAGYILRLDAQGTPVARTALPGSQWRRAGFLRIWGDSLLSLSGFLPVVDVLQRDLSAPIDTMALVGFDSPMLRRTLSYMRGDTDQAPLLSSSAAPVGSSLFVLNIRPGWLRIDVYDHTGRLEHILVERDPGYNKDFYPVDLAVRAVRSDQYEIAIAVIEPVPEVRVYRWGKS